MLKTRSSNPPVSPTGTPHPPPLSSRLAGLSSPARWVIALTIILLLGQALPAAKFFPSPAHYLPLHIVLEFLSIAVSAMVFALAWNLRRQGRNSERILLGAGFLAVCLIDIAHTLSFSGMPNFVTASSPEKAINFWLAGRYAMAGALLLVALMPPRRWPMLAAHSAIGAAIVLSAAIWWIGLAHADWLPRTFIDGVGLTPVKIIAEYLVAAVYAMAAALIYRRGRHSKDLDQQWLAAAAWTLGLAEMFFTLYVDVTDLFNLLGHIYKAIAYVMVYRSLFVGGVQAPYRELDAERSRLKALLSNIPDLIWLKDSQGVYLACNAAFERFFGARESAIIGKTDFDFVDKEQAEFFRQHDRHAMAAEGPSRNEEWLTFATAGYHGLFETTKAPVFNASGQLIGVLGVAHDITARKAAADRIEHLAFYDPLTQLPNRKLMIDRLDQTIANCARRNQYCALILIDLDDFKTLNDTQGHEVGDHLLVDVATRLQSCIREGDTVARIGGDEFMVIVRDLDAPELAASQVEAIAVKIQEHLREPFQLKLSALGDTCDYQCTSSIGITLFNNNSVPGDELVKRVDTAMYQAKAAGRNTLRFFDPKIQAAVSARATLEADLRQAILQNQFVLYYQPQVDSAGRTIGAEALIRWIHPERGLISPAQFIPLAEETGLIVRLGKWVLESACHQLALWKKSADTAHLTVAVNVSARQFALPDLEQQVLDVIKSSGAPPEKLKLELTESLLVENAEAIIEKMTALKSKGVSFSLDDFGTGYSSLSYLKRLPLDQLKIDQSFVRDVLTDPNDAAIARTIVALGQSLGLGVIAEGVETEGQREFLAANGCEHYQGYLFSRPVPLAEFESYLRRPVPSNLLAHSSDLGASHGL